MEVNSVQDQANLLLANPLFFALYAVLMAPLVEEFTFRYLLQAQLKSKKIIRYFVYLLQLTYVLIVISSPLSFYIACTLIISYVLFESGQKLGFVALTTSSSLAFILLHVNMNEPYGQILKLILLYTIMTVVFVVVRIKVGFARGIATHMWYNLVQCTLVFGFVLPKDQFSKNYTLKSELFSWGSQTFQSDDSLYFNNMNLVDIVESLSSSKLFYVSEFATINNWTGSIYSKEHFLSEFAHENQIKLDTCTITFTHYRVQEPNHPHRNASLFFSTWIEGKVDASSTMRNLLNSTNFERKYTIEWNGDVVWGDSAIYFNSNQINTLDFIQLKKTIGFEVIDSSSYPVDLVILRHPISRWFRSTKSICSRVD